MDPTPSLQPVAGAAGDVQRLLAAWLEEDSGATLTVRTSGSTGEPKDVVLSAAALRASATATLTRLGGPGQWLLALPANHVAGLQVLVRSQLGGTTPVPLDDHDNLPAATDAMDGERRYIALVPTQLRRLLADPGSREALASYDAVLVGGGAAEPTLLTTARVGGIQVVTTYGMTETCGGCVYDGRPLDGVAVALAGDGRITIAGSVLFDGYDARPDLTAEVLQDGWLHTNDVGRLDLDGRLQVLGRLDEMVVSGGVNVPLAAVERRLAGMPGLDQVAVVGIPDAEWGTRVVAVINQPADTPAPDLRAMRDFVAVEHPREWAPRQLVVRPGLPLLDSGKVDRQRLVRDLVVRT